MIRLRQIIKFRFYHLARYFSDLIKLSIANLLLPRKTLAGSPEQRVIIKAYHEKQAKKRFRILSKFINP
jgi:hypothetical protein